MIGKADVKWCMDYIPRKKIEFSEFITALTEFNWFAMVHAIKVSERPEAKTVFNSNNIACWKCTLSRVFQGKP